MNKRLEGKTAVVTGSGRGIGRAIALSLSSQGASVVVNSRTRESASGTTAFDVAREIESAGGKAVAIFGDVGTTSAAKSLIEGAMDAFGTLDVLINNAGGGGHRRQIHELDEDNWEEAIRTNLTSQYSCIHFAVPLMKRSAWGRIVNVGSNAGLYGVPGLSAYAAAKAGVIGLTFGLAKEVDGTGITVNCLLPSAQNLQERAQREAATGHVIELSFPPSPNRVPEAIAPLVTFLSSDAAARITGQVIYCSGGQITLYGWPPVARTLFKDGKWTIDEVEMVFPRCFGTDLEAPALPLPLS